MSELPQPLSLIRVVELGWAAAGPLVGTYLASHGADVIHLESSTALDPFRSTYPPFKDNVVGADRAAMFSFYNAGKRGVTLDLKQPRAVELALRLVATADVVIESFPAGTLARRGLTIEAMRAAKPDLVILSSCNQGQTGPHAQHPGYGSQLTALAGFTQLLGDPERTPVILYGPYIDYIAVGYGVIAILAALDRRAAGSYNIGTGVPTSVNELLAQLTALLGPPKQVIRAPEREGEIQRSCVDASKAARDGLWRSEIPLAEGLRRTVAV
jgi:benzylsuccinate CoA-transferase BbsF subunit